MDEIRTSSKGVKSSCVHESVIALVACEVDDEVVRDICCHFLSSLFQNGLTVVLVLVDDGHRLGDHVNKIRRSDAESSLESHFSMLSPFSQNHVEFLPPQRLDAPSVRRSYRSQVLR